MRVEEALAVAVLGVPVLEHGVAVEHLLDQVSAGELTFGRGHVPAAEPELERVGHAVTLRAGRAGGNRDQWPDDAAH